MYSCPTRWNSPYDSIARLIKIKDNLNHLLNTINYSEKSFKDTKNECIEEFCNVIKPMTVVSDWFSS